MNRIGEDITFAQLRTFVCAANAGSFVKAADRLGISQPAVSEQITTLERRLGQSLFRRRRGTTPLLTPEGQSILETVETILAASDDLFASHQLNERPKVIVRMSIGPLLREYYLKPLLPAICRAHPNVEIEFAAEAPLHESIRELEEGGLDLVVRTVAELPDGLPHVKKVCDVPVVIVAQPGTQAKLDNGELSRSNLEIFFPFQRTHYTEKWIGRILRALGLAIDRSAKFLDCGEALPNLVEDGQGAAYLMLETVSERLQAGTLEVLDLPLPPMCRIIAQSPCASSQSKCIASMLSEALHRRADEVLEIPCVRALASN